MRDEISFDEAKLMLQSIGDSVLADRNWDFISVREKDGNFYLEGGVDNIQKEMEKVKNVERPSEINFEKEFQFYVPLLRKPLPAGLFDMNWNKSFEEKEIKFEIKQVTRAVANKPYKNQISVVPPRVKLGDRVAHFEKRFQAGRLGGFIKAKSGEVFGVTACHVVDNPSLGMHASINTRITSPPVSKKFSQKYEIGQLVHWKHTPCVDIAIFRVTRPDRIANASSEIEKIIFANNYTYPFNDEILIYVGDEGFKKGKIKSPYCYKKNRKTGEILKGLIQTSHFAVSGHSGSLVMVDSGNKNYKAIGIMVSEESVNHNYFCTIEYLLEPKSIGMGIKAIEYEFESFIN